ncbi:unnamed protein product [Urochloa humidicola]
MNTPGSKARAAGLALLLISISACINFGASAFGLLLCFAGVLAGASLVGVGVSMADDPAAPIVPVVFDGARALVAFLRRNLAPVGLLMSSCACAVTAVSVEAGPVLCFAMFALLLIGISLINIRVTGE